MSDLEQAVGWVMTQPGPPATSKLAGSWPSLRTRSFASREMI